MQNILIVVDMQVDFISGALGTPEAQAIVPAVKEKIRGFEGKVIFTRDTHEPDYLQTREGKYLPVPHCIRGTDGWQVHPELQGLREAQIMDKPTFGSIELLHQMQAEHTENPIESITLIGLCTDICVISNAMLIKAALPEIDVRIDAACCAGVTPQSHQNALDAMRMCQIIIE